LALILTLKVGINSITYSYEPVFIIQFSL
jgi:hypothetical protein